MSYRIITDSACDLPEAMYAELGLSMIPLTLNFQGKEHTDLSEAFIKRLYESMRQGETASTSAVNPDSWSNVIEPVLAAGEDALVLVFSSGLSTTYQSACMAAQELREEYPQRTIEIVDTLAASAGGGLMTYLAVEKKKAGATLAENAAYLRELVPHHCIWFTVDDLEYLKRGGRISPLAAMAGGMLGIKPILQMDDEGHLVKVSTVRGRKKAIEALAEKYGALSLQEKDTPVFISHAQCEAEARQLGDLLEQRYGAKVTMYAKVGPVIGAHAGPGTIALFFIGQHR